MMALRGPGLERPPLTCPELRQEQCWGGCQVRGAGPERRGGLGASTLSPGPDPLQPCVAQQPFPSLPSPLPLQGTLPSSPPGATGRPPLCLSEPSSVSPRPRCFLLPWGRPRPCPRAKSNWGLQGLPCTKACRVRFFLPHHRGRGFLPTPPMPLPTSAISHTGPGEQLAPAPRGRGVSAWAPAGTGAAALREGPGKEAPGSGQPCTHGEG